ncbi:MAG TPA: hypothetical protein DEP84_15750, partial [Chloroflexi bacterium]|nr:hypothetical protein [Chloroflexota bacterium]
QRLVAEARDQAEAEAQALSQPVLAEAEEESGCVPTGGVSAVTGPLEQHLVEATALLVAWVIGEER